MVCVYWHKADVCAWLQWAVFVWFISLHIPQYLLPSANMKTNICCFVFRSRTNAKNGKSVYVICSPRAVQGHHIEIADIVAICLVQPMLRLLDVYKVTHILRHKLTLKQTNTYILIECRALPSREMFPMENMSGDLVHGGNVQTAYL